VLSGASCTISVTFRPTAPGARSGLLNVRTSAGATFSASLSGSGAGGLTITPASHDFGRTIEFTMSQSFGYDVTNTSNVTFAGVQMTSSDQQFTFASRCSPRLPLAPGASCLVTVTFAPVGVGPRQATLTAVARDATGAELARATAQMLGTGVPVP
jgi:hypothetical protein